MRQKLEYELKALSITFDLPTRVLIAVLKAHLEACSVSEVIRRAWQCRESIQEDIGVTGLFSIRQGREHWLDVCREEDLSLQGDCKRMSITLPERIAAALEDTARKIGIEKSRLVKLVVANLHAALVNQSTGNPYRLATGCPGTPRLFVDLLPRRMSPETAAIAEPAW